jgi:predicted N-acetyltransferase YhbS
MKVQIREAQEADSTAVRDLMLQAFGPDEGPVIARLVSDLLVDPSAVPRLSLVATIGQEVVGYVLFTHAEIASSKRVIEATLLAPLAVHPAQQSQGIGGRLILAGLQSAAGRGAELAFVLGHPGYYPRYGFEPAGILGFEAPYPIADEHADAWMVHILKEGVVGSATGTLSCAAALRDPRHWCE